MILWMRHGESSWNAAGRMQYDAMHPELTEHGREQARLAAETLSGCSITALWASPAVRAQQTAEIVARRLKLDVRTDHLLLEQARHESADDVADRVTRFAGSMSPATVTLAVTHGDTIAVAARVLGSQTPGIIANATWIETA